MALSGFDDPAVLAWAASKNRILLTHDHATMPGFAYERVIAGIPIPGLFVVHDRLPVGQAIDERLLVAQYSTQEERINTVLYFPL